MAIRDAEERWLSSFEAPHNLSARDADRKSTVIGQAKPLASSLEIGAVNPVDQMLLSARSTDACFFNSGRENLRYSSDMHDFFHTSQSFLEQFQTWRYKLRTRGRTYLGYDAVWTKCGEIRGGHVQLLAAGASMWEGSIQVLLDVLAAAST